MPVTLRGHGYKLMSPVCQQEVAGFQRDKGLPQDEPDVIETDVVLKHSTVFPYTGDWR